MVRIGSLKFAISLYCARKIWWLQVFIFVQPKVNSFLVHKFFLWKTKQKWRICRFQCHCRKHKSLIKSNIAHHNWDDFISRFFRWNSNSFWQVCANVIMILNLIQDNNCGALQRDHLSKKGNFHFAIRRPFNVCEMIKTLPFSRHSAPSNE